MADQVFTVTGMTCTHCVNAVSDEITQVPGVQHVDVDLKTGRVVVTGDGYSDAQIRAAVDEAGYALS